MPRMKARIALSAVVAFALLVVAPVRAETVEQWIAKARARFGSESVLNGVTAIHFFGQLETDATTKMPVDIVFQKPLQQRITIRGPKVIEITTLDGYDAWQKRTNAENRAQWQVTLLDAGQIKRLRAQTWDNLNFFTGIEKMGGTVRLGGDATVDGVDCVKLVFTYLQNMVLTRYLEKSTGRLVKTETENGTEIREEGEQIVSGIRFPRKLVNKEAGGKVITFSLDQVVVNEAVPASEFAVPSLQPN